MNQKNNTDKENKVKIMWQVQPSLQSIHLLMRVREGQINKVLIFREASLLTGSQRGAGGGRGAEPRSRGRLSHSCANSCGLCSPVSVHRAGTDWEVAPHSCEWRFPETPTRKLHSKHFALCSNLSFSSDIAARENRAHQTMSLDSQSNQPNVIFKAHIHKLQFTSNTTEKEKRWRVNTDAACLLHLPQSNNANFLYCNNSIS